MHAKKLRRKADKISKFFKYEMSIWRWEEESDY